MLGDGMVAKVALFALADQLFALRVEGVRHIVSVPRIFSLPLLRKGLCGVFLYQGDVVPLLDLWDVLGLETPKDGARGQFSVVHSTESGLIGLPASRILSIVNSGQGIIENGAGGDRAAGMDRVFVVDGTRYPLLDMEKLVTSLPR